MNHILQEYLHMTTKSEGWVLRLFTINQKCERENTFTSTVLNVVLT